VLNIAVHQMMDRTTPKTPFEIELDMIYLKYIDLDTLNSIRGSPTQNFDGIDYGIGRDRKIFLGHAFADFSI
jgi:hypothetical protein